MLGKVAVYTYWLLALVRRLALILWITLGRPPITKVIDDTDELVFLLDDGRRQHKETSRSAGPKLPLV